MIKAHAYLFFSALLLLAGGTRAQVKIHTVEPGQTQAGIKTVHTPHLVVTPGAGNNRHQLIVMIPGTGGHATDFRTFDSTFAAMGYYVVTLDYVNDVITTACSKVKTVPVLIISAGRSCLVPM